MTHTASLRTASATEVSHDTLKSLIAMSGQLPYRFVVSPDANPVSLVVEDLKTACGQRSAFALTEGPNVEGLVICADLPWESRVLGRRQGAIRHLFVNSARGAERLVLCALEWAKDSGIESMVCKVFTDQQEVIHALESSGFRLLETGLICVFDCRRLVPQSAATEFAVRPARDADVPELRSIARLAFQKHFGRFHSDPSLEPEAATRVYEEWILSAIGGYADAVFVAELQGKLAGYSVWKNPSASELAARLKIAHYSIGAVAPEFHGRGVFKALTLAGMREYQKRADWIEGPTSLRNLAVQVAYRRLGWESPDSYHTFQWWQ